MGGSGQENLKSGDLRQIKRIARGDDAAFRSVFDDFFPRLYRYAMAHLDGNREAAEEAVQQTFCKAVERLDTYRGEAPLYAWFVRICRNVITDQYRSRARQAARTLAVEDHAHITAVLDALTAPAVEGPMNQAQARDLRRLVQAILDRLPGRYADILEWKYVEGLSVKEISARLDTGPKAAESLLTRARQAFRDALEALSRAGSAPADELRKDWVKSP